MPNLSNSMPTNTSPQSVSSRYAHNLLVRGSNRTFDLDNVEQHPAWSPGGIACGFYFTARIRHRVDKLVFLGEGATPVAAVISALTSAGVTFR